MAYLKWLVPITILYVMLTGNAEPANWVLGAVVAAGVVFLIRPNPTPMPWRKLPHAVWASLQFLTTLIIDLIKTGIEVARLVLQTDPHLQQGIIAIPDATEHDWITTVSAEAITLTPGELVVEIGDDGTLYTHTLNVEKTLAKSFEAQEKRAQQLENIGL